MSNNFKCPKCNKEIFIQKFRTSFKNGELVNIEEQTGKEIICPDCKEKMKYIYAEGPCTANYGSFSSLSPMEKQLALRKRSREDAIKNKYQDQEREKVFYNA